jgi:putative transposase
MTRPALIRSPCIPYHVTNRTNFGEAFTKPLTDIWPMMVLELMKAHRVHGLAIHAFVLMDNHFHLLCHTPRENLDEVMQSLLKSIALTVNADKPEKTLWRGRYKWSLINNSIHYRQVYRYIYQNPLRAGVVQRVEDYPFTTLQPVPFPLHSPLALSFGGLEGELHWLNQRLTEEDDGLIRLGLRKFEFDVSMRNLRSFAKLSMRE